MGASDQQDLEKQVGQSMLDTSAGLATTSSEQAPFSASGTAQARGSTTVGSSSSSAEGEADIGAVGTMRRNTAAKASGERAEYDEKKVAYDAEHREPPACIKSCQQTLVRWNGSLEAFNQRAKEKRQGRKLAGTRYEVQQNGGKAEGKQKEGDTFVQRHIMVPLVTFIYIWVYIVYVWRLCTPMIRQEPRALNTRGVGITMLILFNILWLITVWSYIRVLVAKPGFVKDSVPESEPPELPPVPSQQQQQWQATGQGQGAMQQTQALAQPDAHSIPIEQSGLADGLKPQEGQPDQRLRVEEEEEDINVNPALAAAVGPMAAAAVSGAKEQQVAQQQMPQPLVAQPPNGPLVAPVPQAAPALLPEPVRMPPEVPPLFPSQLYCRKCKRIKPPRAHHCRKCGQCVLKMDHHCPWVGGCVGARNHKFFHNFLLWTTLLEVYMLITVAFHFARGWFTLFTSLLLTLHTYLFVRNMTTIEQFANQRREARERVMLTMYFSPQGQGHALKRELGPLGERKERRAIKRRWEKAWGELSTQGSLWWLGGPGERYLAEKRGAEGRERVLSGELDEARKLGVNGKGAWLTNWKEVMGTGVPGWFLPIGKTPGDGLHYPLNPRFGLDGSWKTREAWAEELR